MDSKGQFFKTIKDEYDLKFHGEIPDHLIRIISIELTDYYYDQYNRFRKDYPKSAKRYSTFHTKDLHHPDSYEIVINVLKSQFGTEYETMALKFLNMTKDELRDFEQMRKDYHNM